MQQKHKHKAKTVVRLGFSGRAAGAEENRAAHGCVCEIARCACGAVRETNINGPHVERGTWKVAR